MKQNVDSISKINDAEPVMRTSTAAVYTMPAEDILRYNQVRKSLVDVPYEDISQAINLKNPAEGGNLFNFYINTGDDISLWVLASDNEVPVLKKFLHKYKISYHFDDDFNFFCDESAIRKMVAEKIIKKYQKNTKKLEKESERINSLIRLRKAQTNFASRLRKDLLDFIFSDTKLLLCAVGWYNYDLDQKRTALKQIFSEWIRHLCPSNESTAKFSFGGELPQNAMGGYHCQTKEIVISNELMSHPFDIACCGIIHEIVHWLQYSSLSVTTPLSHKGLREPMDLLENSSGPNVLNYKPRYENLPKEVEARYISERMSYNLFHEILLRAQKMYENNGFANIENFNRQKQK